MDSWKVVLVDRTAGGVVPPADLKRYASALQTQVDDHLAPAWGVRADITVLAPGVAVPAGAWPINVVDSLTGMSGVHRDDHGKPYAEAVNEDQLSVTLSHELLEMLVDPMGSRFTRAADLDPNSDGHQVYYLVEVSDPCDTFSYFVGDVQVADFILPSFFEPGAAGPVDQADFLDGPLSVPPRGCYISWFDPEDGNWHGLQANGIFDVGPPNPSRNPRDDRDALFGTREPERHNVAAIHRKWPQEIRCAPERGASA
jgi:hypothetical protein